MADLMQDAMSWLEGNREAYLSGGIVYSRGGTSLSLNATMGETMYEVADDDNMLTEVRTKDFIVQTSDFRPIFNDPLIGDTIIQEIDGKQYKYEVNTPSGESAFSLDSYELSYRIHTLAIDSNDI